MPRGQSLQRPDIVLARRLVNNKSIAIADWFGDYFAQNTPTMADNISAGMLNIDAGKFHKAIEDENYQYAWNQLIRRLNVYAPIELQYHTTRPNDTHCGGSLSKESLRHVTRAVLLAEEWLYRIEDMLTIRLLNTPKCTNILEVLKRRCRDNWGDVGQSKSITVANDKDSGKLELIITEA